MGMRAKLLLVFCGGAVGAMVREVLVLLGPLVQAGFVPGVLAANTLAAFLLGLLAGSWRRRRVSDGFFLLAGTGFLGGMSTFSALAYGILHHYLLPGHWWRGLAYAVVSLALGYAALCLGLWLARHMGPDAKAAN